MNCTLLAVASLSDASSSVLLDSTVKGTALLMLAAVAALILRRDSAATRHLIWLLAIVAMLVVPVLSLMLPQWQVLPRWTEIRLETAVADASPPSMAEPIDEPVELPRNAEPVVIERPPATAYRPAAELPDARPALAATEIVPESAVWSWNWRNVLPLVWAIGFSVLILRLMVARWMLWHIERRAPVIGSSARPTNATDDLVATAIMSARLQLGIRRPITLLIHPEKTIPITWGIFRYYLLLPAAARQWSGEQLRSVLLHESAHIRRRDTLAQLLAHIACALYWFNPLAWLAAWRLRVEGERACDDLVLASGVRPSAYAGHLLDVVTGLSPVRGTQSCGLAMARKSSLEGRLLAVLSENLNRRGISLVLAAITLAVTVGIAVPIAMLRAAEEKPGNEPTPATADAKAKAGQHAEEAERLLSLMRANDARFDRVTIEYLITRIQPLLRSEMSWDPDAPNPYKVDPKIITPETTKKELDRYAFIMAPGYDESKRKNREWNGRLVAQLIKEGDIVEVIRRPIAFPPPEGIALKHIETLMVRGSDLAGSRTPANDGKPDARTPQVDRWRSIGHTIKMLTGSSDTNNPDDIEWITEVAKTPYSMNNLQEQALDQQFALGFGFASRVRNVTSLTTKDGLTVLEGQFQMWEEDKSTCRLVIDEHHLVREATIHCNVRGNKSEFFISSEGVFDVDGRFRCARSGKLRRFSPIARKNLKDFLLEVRRVSFDFSDAKFEQFASLEPPAGAKKTRVIDRDAPRAGDDKRGAEPRPAAADAKPKGGAKLEAGMEKSLRWGKPAGGLRAALVIRPVPGATKPGDKPELYLAVQNVSDAPIRLSDTTPAPKLREVYEKHDGRILVGIVSKDPTGTDVVLQPHEAAFLLMFPPDAKSPDKRTIGSTLAQDLLEDTHMMMVAEMRIDKAPAGAWTGKLRSGETNGEAAAGKPRPKSGEGQKLFQQWQAYARTNGKIPGALIGKLGDNVRWEVAHKNGGNDRTVKYEKLLPRFDATHDWSPSDAVALLDDVSAINTNPIGAALLAADENMIRHGRSLPAELADVPWGKPSPDGLRVAWLLEPRAKEYPLNMALKSRVLVHNSGKKTAVFCIMSWLQGGGNAHDAKGADIPVSSIAWEPFVTRKTYRLAPGEYCETPAAGVHVGLGAKTDNTDWASVHVGARIDTKPGDDVRFSPFAVQLLCGDKDATDFRRRIVAERVGRELPIPAAAAERTQIIRRVTLDLCGQSPTPDEIAAFVADNTPAAAANLEKRLANRPGIAPFMGTLSPGDIHFRVLAPDPDGAKKPNTVTADTKPKGGETNTEAAAGKPRPKSKEGQTLFKQWQANARIDGKIPGGLVGRLGKNVRGFISANKGYIENGRKLSEEFEKLLPRFDANRDWTPSDAIAIIDDVSAIHRIPLLGYRDSSERNAMRGGEPLPAELANAPWGKPSPDGLCVARLLEPRAKEYPLGTPLKSRILVYNAGKKTAIFIMPDYQDSWFAAHDANGAAINKSLMMALTGIPQKRTYRLMPGMYCESPTAGVGVGANAGERFWIDAKPGDIVRFTPDPVIVNCSPAVIGTGPDGRPRDFDPKDAADLLAQIIAERVERELPLPVAAAEREQLLRRVTLDLFGQSPTPEEIAAFVGDKTPAAVANLEKRLAQRPDVAPFTGGLQPGDIQFRVLAPNPDAAKKPLAAIAVTPSQVLENLKKYDAIFESGFSVSGTVEEQFPFNADTGARRREERRWKFTHDGDRWGWKCEVIHFEIPENKKVGSEMVVRTRDWGYGGSDVSGEYYQDTNFRVTAKNETTETGKGPMVVLYGPRDRHAAVGVYYYMWALGRMFSKELDKVIRVEKSKDGLLVVSARGKNAVWHNNGRWELEIDTAAAWMVRKARYYAPDYVDGKRECLYVEMTNSGTVRSGSYCIPKKATINIFAVVGKENARRMTFDPVVGKFDEKLYSDVQQAVAHNEEPNLKLDDQRVSPSTFTEPNRFKPEPAQH